MKEEPGDQTTSPVAESNSNRNAAESHNALMQHMYNGMYASTPGYTPSDVMTMQYAYMYNAYLQQSMYAQHPAYMASYYASLDPRTAQGSNTQKSDKPSTNQGEKLDNAKYQMKSTSPKDNVRYEPYRRKSTSAPVSPVYSANRNSVVSPGPSAAFTPYVSMATTGSRAIHGSVDNVNSHEAPVDLSQKTQKLQFLSTLKDLIEKQNRREEQSTNANETRGKCNTLNPQQTNQMTSNGVQKSRVNKNIKDNGKTNALDMSTRDSNASNTRLIKVNTGGESTSRCVVDAAPSQALKSTEDKHAYIAVLRELFEKGHSRTSEKILATESSSHAQRNTKPLSNTQESTSRSGCAVNNGGSHLPVISEIKRETVDAEGVNTDTTGQLLGEVTTDAKNGDRDDGEDLNTCSDANSSLDDISIEQSLVLKFEAKKEHKSFTQL